ncbi:MAG: hypothetical protein DRJ67_08885 [Thermoprotei archaeon]|nr:MAG: hypothetical protein DRJ67_08885 [Thermoprotei archaeon]
MKWRSLLIEILCALALMPLTAIFLPIYGNLLRFLGVGEGEPSMVQVFLSFLTATSLISLFLLYKVFREEGRDVRDSFHSAVKWALPLGLFMTLLVFGIGYLGIWLTRLGSGLLESVSFSSFRVVGTYPVTAPHPVLERKLIILPPNGSYASELLTVKSDVLDAIVIEELRYTTLCKSYPSACSLGDRIVAKMAESVGAYHAPLFSEWRVFTVRAGFCKEGSYEYSINIWGSGNQPFEVRVLDERLRVVGKHSSSRVDGGYELIANVENPRVCKLSICSFYVVVRNLGRGEATIQLDISFEESYELIIAEYVDPYTLGFSLSALCAAIFVITFLYLRRAKKRA